MLYIYSYIDNKSHQQILLFLRATMWPLITFSQQPQGSYKASLEAQMVKVSAYNVGEPGSIPGLGRSPGEENGNPLQYSCLGNPTDKGAWKATVHGVVKELDTT